MGKSADTRVLSTTALLQTYFGLSQRNWRQETMNAISKNWTGTDPPSEIPRRVHFVFWGAVIGLIAGLVTLATAATVYGFMTGLEPVNCAIFGTTMTVMLSQPTALVGLVLGAACGGLCALVAHATHEHLSAK